MMILPLYLALMRPPGVLGPVLSSLLQKRDGDTKESSKGSLLIKLINLAVKLAKFCVNAMTFLVT